MYSDEEKKQLMDDLKEMAHKCAIGVGGAKGSAKLLKEEDMLAIYRASV